MALLFVLLLSVIIPCLSQTENRCGTGWSVANSDYCATKCPDGVDSECPSGQSCYGQLPVGTCGSSSSSGSTSDGSGSTSTGTKSGSSSVTLTLNDLQSIMGGTTLSQDWVDAVNTCLSRYGLDTILRTIGFLSEARHETAGMTIFHQPIDNGGGLFHMTPANWKGACQNVKEIAQAFGNRYSGCGDCSCIDAMAADPLGSTATDASINIFSIPMVAALSGGWWFDSGAYAAFGWKGCTEKLGVYADQGKGAAGSSDCTHTGNYQLCCCIFWTIGSGSGIDQRNKYYDDAASYAATAWGYKADTAEEVTQFHGTPVVNAGIAIGCVAGITAIVVVIVAVYLKRKQRIQSEVV